MKPGRSCWRARKGENAGAAAPQGEKAALKSQHGVRRLQGFAFLAPLLLASALHAPPARAAVGCEPDAIRYRLDNGLEVVLLEEHRLPLVSVVSSVEGGSRRDPVGYRGLSHYVEHLLYRGSFGFGPYEEVGATFNGQVDTDSTTYFVELESSQLERALWLEARRFTVGLAQVDEPGARAEVDVVRRENEQRSRDRGRDIQRAFYSSAFGESHPYHDHLRDEEDLERMTLAAARWMHEQTYAAERARLVVAGDFDPDRTRELIAKYWGGIRSQPPDSGARPPPADAPDPLHHTLAPLGAVCELSSKRATKLPKRIRVRRPERDRHFEVVWALDADQDPIQAARVLSLWAGGVAGPLRDKGWLQSLRTQPLATDLAAFVDLSIGLSGDSDLAVVEDMVWQRLEEFRAVGESSLEKGDVWRREAERVELVAEMRRPGTLGRALALADRSCLPLHCSADEALTVEELRALLPLFDRSRSLVVESASDLSKPVEVIQ